MKNRPQSVLIWYSAEEMFALVTDVAKYSEFLPWCDHASVLALEPDGMKAEIGIAFPASARPSPPATSTCRAARCA
jgi:ribosome-associated toxin RatA of RatAB toxin-antitoxin module